jgi:hypothetical protein
MATIGWLPDLDALLGGHDCGSVVQPRRALYCRFSSHIWMMDENFEKIKYDYFNTSVIVEENNGTIPIKCRYPFHEFSWNHSFTEIFTALIKNGLQIEAFEEFP